MAGGVETRHLLASWGEQRALGGSPHPAVRSGAGHDPNVQEATAASAPTTG